MFILDKWWINRAKINRFVADEFAENVEIITVKEFVHKSFVISRAKNGFFLQLPLTARHLICRDCE